MTRCCRCCCCCCSSKGATGANKNLSDEAAEKRPASRDGGFPPLDWPTTDGTHFLRLLRLHGTCHAQVDKLLQFKFDSIQFLPKKEGAWGLIVQVICSLGPCQDSSVKCPNPLLFPSTLIVYQGSSCIDVQPSLLHHPSFQQEKTITYWNSL